MKLLMAAIDSLLILLSVLGVASAQAPIITLRLAKDQIATVKTAPGITTRLVFPDPVEEIICGDLYDPASGRGSFVIQRGDKDVFLKPVATKGLSNMFVKTGQSDSSVYSFDLLIVTPDQAHRVVNVLDVQGAPAGKARGPAGAIRVTPPVTASIPVVDWKVDSSPGGTALAAYSLPGSTNDAEPPPPPRLSTPSSDRPSTRAPIQGDPTKRVRAMYPEFAKAAGLNGEVAVEIVVGENGKVISATALSGPVLLRQAAINAALGWRYVPARVDGVPVQAVGRITFRFGMLDEDRNGQVKANGKAQNSSSRTATSRRP